MTKSNRGKKIAIILVLVFFLLFTIMSVLMYFIKPSTHTTEDLNTEMSWNIQETTGLVVTGFEA